MKTKRLETFSLSLIFWRYWSGDGFSIKDYNLLGTGNEINSSITLNSEQALFKINYTTKSNIFLV